MATRGRPKKKQSFFRTGEVAYIETDFAETVDGLEELGSDKEKKRTLKGLLGSVGNYAKSQVKRSYSHYLNKQSGDLYKSIGRTLTKSGKAVVVSANARKNGKVLYGYALTKGSLVLPKWDREYWSLHHREKEWMYIPTIGKRLWGFRLQAKDFVEEPVREYLGSQKCKDNMAKYLDKRIEKVLIKARGYK